MKHLMKLLFWGYNILALVQAAYIALGHRELYRSAIFVIVIVVDLLALFRNHKREREARRRKKLLDNLIR
jgi:Flp pilus assembly protein TadB